MKTRLAVLGALAVLALGAVATTGTYAWVNTRADTGDQRIDAGTLHLLVGMPSKPVPADNMQPGERRRLGVVSVANTGTVDGELAFEALEIQDQGVSPSSAAPVPGPAPGSFSSHLRVDVTEDTPTGTTTLVASVPLAALASHDLGPLAAADKPGSTRVLTVWIAVDTEAGNEVQGERVTFRLLALLRQAG